MDPARGTVYEFIWGVSRQIGLIWRVRPSSHLILIPREWCTVSHETAVSFRHRLPGRVNTENVDFQLFPDWSTASVFLVSIISDTIGVWKALKKSSSSFAPIRKESGSMISPESVTDSSGSRDREAPATGSIGLPGRVIPE